MFILPGSKPQNNSIASFYKPLQGRFRRMWLPVCLALALTVLPAVATPLLGAKTANSISNTAIVLAEECSGGTCG